MALGLEMFFGIAQDLLGRFCMYRRILQSFIRKEGENVRLLDSSEWGQGPVEGFCEYGNEPSGMIKVRNFMTSYMSTQLQKRDLGCVMSNLTHFLHTCCGSEPYAFWIALVICQKFWSYCSKNKAARFPRDMFLQIFTIVYFYYDINC